MSYQYETVCYESPSTRATAHDESIASDDTALRAVVLVTTMVLGFLWRMYLSSKRCRAARHRL